MPNLASVDLRDNELTGLPGGLFEGLGRLTTLTLSHQPGLALREEAFSPLVSLEDLALDHAGIESLPDGTFASLGNLRRLSLRHNPSVRELPRTLFDPLVSLERLHVGLGLDEVGRRHFESLGSLEELAITDNGADCAGTVQCPGRPLAFTADTLVPLARLRRLDLSNNGLARLPDTLLAGLDTLEDLILSRNLLDRVPEGLFALAGLRMLRLDHNAIAAIDERGLRNLHHLRRLYLNDNALAELPEAAFHELRDLDTLWLDGNPGAPFDVALALVRTDAPDLAPPPATVALRIAGKSPFTMLPFDLTVPVAVQRGSLSRDSLTLKARQTTSPAVEATAAGGAAHVHGHGGHQVHGNGYRGLRYIVAEPLTLFARTRNRLPKAIGRIPPHTGTAGELLLVHELPPEPAPPVVADVRSYFADDGPLRYTASSTASDIVDAEVVDHRVALHPRAAGQTTVRLRATDGSGLFAEHAVEVAVVEPDPSRFDVDIAVFARGGVSKEQIAAIEVARSRWEALIVGDLPDVTLEAPVRSPCRRSGPGVFGGTVDDIRVFLHIVPTAAVAEPRWQHRGSAAGGLPTAACVYLPDEGGDRALFASLGDYATHELAHALGFHSAVWERRRLVRDPPNGDAHFTGPLAVRAFNDSGGSAYLGRKVPLQRSQSHWRGTWSSYVAGDTLHREIMGNPAPRATEPWADAESTRRTVHVVSAITVQAMADLGYAVDVSRVDHFEVPAPQE